MIKYVKDAKPAPEPVAAVREPGVYRQVYRDHDMVMSEIPERDTMPETPPEVAQAEAERPAPTLEPKRKAKASNKAADKPADKPAKESP